MKEQKQKEQYPKEQYQIGAIAHIVTDFSSKFGIPRQSGLVEELEGRILFEPEYGTKEAVKGLEEFSHIWLIWGFSENRRESYSLTVRPPKLGGNTRKGVFSTRSPFRPNGLGLSCVRLEKIEFDEKSSSIKLGKNMKIDLGGIAKGYTSSRVMQIFKDCGVTSGLVSLGGNVQALGTKTDGTDWQIAIENPDKSSDYIGVVSVKDKAVITSGGYERYFEKNGKTYHHILDPKTGYPAESGLKSVTIVSDNGTLADALSTSLFVMGKEKALDYWREHKNEFDTVLVEDNGNITITDGLKKVFKSNFKFDIAK